MNLPKQPNQDQDRIYEQKARTREGGVSRAITRLKKAILLTKRISNAKKNISLGSQDRHPISDAEIQARLVQVLESAIALRGGYDSILKHIDTYSKILIESLHQLALPLFQKGLAEKDRAHLKVFRYFEKIKKYYETHIVSEEMVYDQFDLYSYILDEIIAAEAIQSQEGVIKKEIYSVFTKAINTWNARVEIEGDHSSYYIDGLILRGSFVTGTYTRFSDFDIEIIWRNHTEFTTSPLHEFEPTAQQLDMVESENDLNEEYMFAQLPQKTSEYTASLDIAQCKRDGAIVEQIIEDEISSTLLGSLFPYGEVDTMQDFGDGMNFTVQDLRDRPEPYHVQTEAVAGGRGSQIVIPYPRPSAFEDVILVTENDRVLPIDYHYLDGHITQDMYN